MIVTRASSVLPLCLLHPRLVRRLRQGCWFQNSMLLVCVSLERANVVAENTIVNDVKYSMVN